MFINIAFSIIIGGMVGICNHVEKNGKLIMPYRTKKFFYPGFILEMLMGSFAAVLLVLYAEPDSPVQVGFLSILAGFGGESVIKVIEVLKPGTSGK
ncbi:DUF4257 domain-containing protein [Neobacillus sp. PS3-34]|uniref:DUF4257 domain-containing protein n=1 Tax=Neobacillus sp. PS3-34 TaxID=3070678 RepID=UPI0027E04559|nr:DUF4257 domain-containing protein [Neobacillus sp. PS3-34]WML49201.1 DUF4257 domain-containing protein [Neobacillus sp. PS3-34]